MLEQQGFGQKRPCLTNLIRFQDKVPGRIDRDERVKVYHLSIQKA